MKASAPTVASFKEWGRQFAPAAIAIAYIGVALSIQHRWVGHPNLDPWGPMGLQALSATAWLLSALSLWSNGLRLLRAILGGAALVAVAFLAFLYIAGSLWGM